MKKKIAVLTSGWSVDFVIPVIKGMQQACKEADADLYVFCCYPFPEIDGTSNSTGFAIFDLMNQNDYDGVVLLPHLFNDQTMVSLWHKRILESGIPAVTINHPLEGISSVYSDNKDAYKNLILHLINEHKTTSFAYIGGPDDNAGSLSNYSAFVEALTESNIPIDYSLIFTNGDWTYEWAVKTAENIFDGTHKIPEAIVCVNDWAGMAAIKVAASHNYSVPNDIKVIGFDDVYLSGKVIPSISSIHLSAEELGIQAVDVVLNTPGGEITGRKILAEPVYRQSCGCVQKVTSEQIQYSQNFSRELYLEQRFASQLRHLEDDFINNITFDSVIDNLQKYFQSRHFFEGSDFAILLNQNVIDSLNENITNSTSTSYDTSLQTISHLINGKIADCPKISPSQLIPPSMENSCETGNLFLFLPIFNQKYLHGYYVSKNCFNLLENKRAYNWTRNFGTMIEKFRQTAIYCALSEQMKILSTKDALSGLLNRAGLDSYAIDLFTKNNQEGKSTVILFIDINNMKIINDKYGHLQGDLAVKTVSEAITKIVPDDFLSIRYGGDEFVVIGTVSSSDIPDYIQQIDEKLTERVKRMTLPYNLTVSSGCKIFAPNEITFLNDAIQEVDDIMYKVKQEFHSKEKL